MSRGRRIALATIVALCVGAGILYMVLAALDPNSVTTSARPLAAASALPESQLLVRAVDPNDPRLNGQVFAIREGRAHRLKGEELACERVYFAADSGLCLATAESGIDYEATIFDSSLRPVEELPLAGVPSRARVSNDGRLGAMTVFVNGHAYLGSGGFSTETTIVDMRSGQQLGHLENFAVSKDGQPFDAVDFNFWGITFAEDPNRFFATLRTDGSYYLVEGDIEKQTMRVLRDGVECPSLSPDGTQIAYKSRIGDENRWRLKVLELSTLRDHAVAERRSIDDQVEWLDDGTLVYSDGFDVFTVPADGSGTPRLVVHDATSPVALRTMEKEA